MDVESKVKNPLIERAISILGRQQDMAVVLGVAQQTVSKLLLGEIPLKAEWALAIDRATDGEVSKSDLRPDLWPPGSPPTQPISEAAAS